MKAELAGWGKCAEQANKLMKKHLIMVLLILGAWRGASTVLAATAGAVVAWGESGDGESLVPVAAQSDVTAIAAGSYHIVALKNDGSVLSWGDNAGQTTVPIAAQSGVTA